MENAAKALTIAGGILISLLILGIIIFGYNNLSNLSKQQEDKKEIEQLAAFNKEYESYNRKLLRGVDIISLMNKAIDNNEKYKDNLNYYKITIEFKLVNDLAAYKRNSNGEVIVETRYSLKENKCYSVENLNSIGYETLMDREETDVETFNDFKRRIFDCTGLEYNKKSGRVNKMVFVEREQDLTQGIIE